MNETALSFGYSFSDFVAVGTLAWDVCKSCKAAPESFANISTEVSSLYAVIKEAEETVFARPLSLVKQAGLKAVGDECYSVLEDVENLVERYRRLGTQGRRAWDRMEWDTEDIAELRSRLISSTILLAGWITTSQANVERMLDGFMQEFREGRRKGSVIPTLTVESLSVDEKQAWRAIRKELEEVGIPVAALDANKDFIINWLTEAIASGVFEEQMSDDDSIMGRYEDSLTKLMAPTGGLSVPQVAAQGSSIYSASTSSEELKGRQTATTPQEAFPGSRVTRIAAFIAALSRPNKGLIVAALGSDESKALEILGNDAKASLIDRETLNRTLKIAAYNGKGYIVQMLLKNGASINDGGIYDAVCSDSEKTVRLLLERCANISADSCIGTALCVASFKGNERIVRLLLEEGADINADSYIGTALCVASFKGNEQMVQLLLEEGADINAESLVGTALWIAAFKGNEGMVRLLLEEGADINAELPIGTALWIAASWEHEQVVRLLLEKGADVNRNTLEGPAICAAVFQGAEHIVSLLLEKGADVNVFKGRVPLTIVALERGHERIVELVLMKGDADSVDWKAIIQAWGGRCVIVPDSQRILEMLSDRGLDWIVLDVPRRQQWLRDLV